MKYFIYDMNEEVYSGPSMPEIDFITGSQKLSNLSYNENKNDDAYFIGFVNGDTCIQFSRIANDSLLFDAPIVENDEYVFSYTKDEITKEAAIQILKYFFEGKNWMELQDFEKEYPEYEDDEEEETDNED